MTTVTCANNHKSQWSVGEPMPTECGVCGAQILVYDDGNSRITVDKWRKEFDFTSGVISVPQEHMETISPVYGYGLVDVPRRTTENEDETDGTSE